MASSIQKYIKNVSGSDQTIEGQLITTGTYYLIQATEEAKFASSSTLLGFIADGTVLMAKTDTGSEDITDLNQSIDFLKQMTSKEVVISNNLQAFASKELHDGSKLYKRKHGVKGSSIPANSSGSVIFTAPYTLCKLTDVEVLKGREGDEVDFFILDTALGTVSGIPNFPLNQFGFDVQITKDKHSEHSDYDADLFSGLQIMFQYYNNNDSAVKPVFNITLHEVKPL